PLRPGFGLGPCRPPSGRLPCRRREALLRLVLPPRGADRLRALGEAAEQHRAAADELRRGPRRLLRDASAALEPGDPRAELQRRGPLLLPAGPRRDPLVG